MPTTPMEALQRLIEIIKTGIASGHLLGTLRENWQEIVDAVCDLIQWALTLDDDKIDPVGASGDGEGMMALGHQLAVFCDKSVGPKCSMQHPCDASARKCQNADRNALIPIRR